MGTEMAYTTCPACGCDTASSNEASINKRIAELENELLRLKKFSKKQGEQLALCAKGMSH